MADQPGGVSASTRGFYEDMVQRVKTAPPELRAPLAMYKGEPPPAPAWFRKAIANEPGRGFVPTPRGRIEALTWGEVGKPGLLFVHGNTAHADWWSFICPLFADRYRVTAMSLAGMGDSDWRDHYSFETFVDDAQAVSHATGLHEGGRKPVYIGHSFGGGQVFHVASRHPDHIHSAILIDVGFSGPPEGVVANGRAREFTPPHGPIRVYPSLTEALARFRLSPMQMVENPFILDHIARHSLKRAPMPDGSGEGWSWKFDPAMWLKFDRRALDAFFASSPKVGIPIAHLYGELSALRAVPGLSDAYPESGLEIGIPNAHHHVMVDEPLALTAAIRCLLAAWRA